VVRPAVSGTFHVKNRNDGGQVWEIHVEYEALASQIQGRSPVICGPQAINSRFLAEAMPCELLGLTPVRLPAWLRRASPPMRSG